MQFYKARNDNVACTMIGAWLVELYLHERERNVIRKLIGIFHHVSAK